MPEPLKAILTVATIACGFYAFDFIKNTISTGKVNPDYVIRVFVSFFGILAFGLAIWGIVRLFQMMSRRRKLSRTVVRKNAAT
ncbi:MAG: hypothetical protein PHO26_02485 [Dehalococcoidia bacterium]|nr:hypothetical protein [Dehalococcoidia bacterium]MDD5494151.1 hypothetical protein [Dehalococcoidia bacterium]